MVPQRVELEARRSLKVDVHGFEPTRPLKKEKLRSSMIVVGIWEREGEKGERN